MTIVRFGSGGLRQVGGHTVEFRQRWVDDWSESSNAHCTDAAWALSPSMPTATIVWPYGVVKTTESNAYQVATKLTVSRWYVRVTFVTDVAEAALADEDNPDRGMMRWYGVVSDVQDDQAGYVTSGGVNYATGQQTLHCYGLEYLLDQSSINNSWYYDFGDMPESTDAVLTFNGDGRTNRSIDRMPSDHVDNAYVFQDPATLLGREWSTRDIVRYLLRWQGPSKSSTAYNRGIEFTLANETYLDLTDAPVVPQEGMTVLALLQRLIDRRRLMSFYLRVNASNVVELVPVSFTANDIDLGESSLWTIPRNASQKTVYYERDELTRLATREVDVKAVDRVIARGARRTSTCTMYVDEETLHTVLQPDWDTTTDEVTYEDGASNVTGYSTWTLKTKQSRNQEVRSHEALRAVYSWFRLYEGWPGSVKASTGAYIPVFVDDEGRAIDDFYTGGIRILPYIPLYAGIEYGGTAPTLGEPEDPVYRRPFCVFLDPSTDRYLHGERIAELSEGDFDPAGDGNSYRWSAYVRPQSVSPIVEIHVTGEPQHVIANTDFTPLADDDRDLGDFDYRDIGTDKGMLITLALEEPRYAEASYPAAGVPDSAGIDAQRALVIWAGDDYRQDYVANLTVVDVDEDGALVETDESYVTYVRDDTDKLEVMARLAYEWYTTDRAVVSLETKRLTNELSVGDMITTLGDITIDSYTTHSQSVNTVITSLRIQTPRIRPGSTAEPTMTVVTDAGELDPLTLLPGRVGP